MAVELPLQRPGGHAAERDAGQVGGAARAEHHKARVVPLGGVRDGGRDETVPSSPAAGDESCASANVSCFPV